jgi:NADH-quinone oxidoreductase subunit M
VALSILASEASHVVGTSPLTAAVVVPFIGAVVVALVPKGRTELHRLVALLFATGTGALTLWLLAAFETGDAGFQFEVNRTWISEFGISWHLGIDGISLFPSCCPVCCSRW